MNEFRQFVLDQLKKRHESNREFARRVGVSNQTINRLVDERYEVAPTPETILAIAQATGVSAVVLFEMAYPEARQNALSADARALAQRIEALPPEQRAMIAALLRGIVEK